MSESKSEPGVFMPEEIEEMSRQLESEAHPGESEDARQQRARLIVEQAIERKAEKEQTPAQGRALGAPNPD